MAETEQVLVIKTVQIAPIRTLFTALKDILIETNIIFTPEGIRIISMDKSHTILVNMNLYAPNFEMFECKKPKIVIGLNVPHLFKLINTIDNEDTLTIFIDKCDYTDGIVSYLGLKFENAKQCKTQKLRLLEPDGEELFYPNVTFSSIINLPSVDFQKIIRDLTGISDKIELKSVSNELMFKCVGNFATVEIVRKEINGSMEYVLKQDSNKIIQGEFSLKNLVCFTKCTHLCSQIEMYLENDLPIVVKYNVASLGDIKLCLSSLPSS